LREKDSLSFFNLLSRDNAHSLVGHNKVSKRAIITIIIIPCSTPRFSCFPCGVTVVDEIVPNTLCPAQYCYIDPCWLDLVKDNPNKQVTGLLFLLLLSILAILSS
jgi:hypothetical protein